MLRVQITRYFAFVLAVASIAGCGNSRTATHPSAPLLQGPNGIVWVLPSRPMPGVMQRTVGRGPQAAVMLWQAGHPRPSHAIIFFHGWQPVPPSYYEAWLSHLAERGNLVIYPVYQDLDTKSGAYLRNASAGIRSALDQGGVDRRTVVAFGESTGGTLAFNYAVESADLGLPTPRLVYALFPALGPADAVKQARGATHLPETTRLVTLAGSADPYPKSEAVAKALLRSAPQVPQPLRSFRRVPGRTGDPNRRVRPSEVRAARRAIWMPADRAIAVILREAAGEK
jgi:acetyl esterase/lipase